MPLHFILPLISSLLLYQSGAVSTDNQPKPYEEAEAYEVYSAILPAEWPWRAANAKSFKMESGELRLGVLR
jgi:hypothetical protein